MRFAGLGASRSLKIYGRMPSILSHSQRHAAQHQQTHATLIPAVRNVLKDSIRTTPAHGVYPLEDLVDATIARDRQAMPAVVFAIAAVGLAIVSVYGVLSQRVAAERSVRLVFGWRWREPLPSDRMGGYGRMRMILVGISHRHGERMGADRNYLELLFGVQPTSSRGTRCRRRAGECGLIAALLPSWRATRIDRQS